MQLSAAKGTTEAKRKAKRAGQKTEKASANSGLQAAERFGYVVRGLLYGAMGVLALGAAVHIGGAFEDQASSVWLLARAPFGRLVVASFVVGIGAYGLWGFVRAGFDPLNRGEGAPGIANRLGWAWSGLSYTMLAIFALRVATGRLDKPPGDSVTAIAARVFALPGGRAVTLALGVVAVTAGAAQFVDAYLARWRRDLKRREMTTGERAAALWLGRFGLAARGVTFTVVGWLLVIASLNADPGLAKGYAGAFRFVQTGPAGGVLLALVALGFVALGLHSFACARWIKLAGR
ncbi:MAG TPA: DUF1206 domain-containing protein [Candidatus Dormibacteraeota bacterium]